jgi:hypothetical protein
MKNFLMILILGGLIATAGLGWAIVVFGGGTPTGTFGGAIVQVSSTAFPGLQQLRGTPSLSMMEPPTS